MKFKLLNGDILIVDCDFNTLDEQATSVYKDLLSTELGVMKEQIRLILSSDTQDTLVLIVPYGFLDMRKTEMDWNDIPNHLLHILARHPDIQREIHRVKKKTYGILPETSDCSEINEQNVQMILDRVDEYKCKDGFCLNSNDRIVDWLLEHPEYISFPQFLGNSNPRAVQYSMDWLLTRYQTLEDIFNYNPDVFELYLMYLTRNTDYQMFWFVWRNCQYLKPRTPLDILLRVCNIPQIEIVFREESEHCKWF